MLKKTPQDVALLEDGLQPRHVSSPRIRPSFRRRRHRGAGADRTLWPISSRPRWCRSLENSPGIRPVGVRGDDAAAPETTPASGALWSGGSALAPSTVLGGRIFRQKLSRGVASRLHPHVLLSAEQPIAGQPLDHMLYHFRLKAGRASPMPGWTTAARARRRYTRDCSARSGISAARPAEHRTDSVSGPSATCATMRPRI